MWRIKKYCEGPSSRVKLAGQIQAHSIDAIKSVMSDADQPKILDLSEVTLVDISVVGFLIDCEDAGIRLIWCPAWVGEWMIRERTERATETSHVN